MSTALRPSVAPTTLGALPSEAAVMAQTPSENFPVAGLMLGRKHRAHLLAIYGYARLVDDTGDEMRGDRALLLDEIERQLTDIYRAIEPSHPVMRRLRGTIEACGLPAAPFQRLIEANRCDQVVTRYDTFDALLGYCQLSAAPVGELVLNVFGAASPERIALSDRVCAGLQVIEHLQDVAEDYARGRIYLPVEDLTNAGCEERELAAPQASPALRSVVELLARRSGQLLAAGSVLARQLALRPRTAVAGFVAGGRATLRAIDRADHDVLAHRPRRTAPGFVWELLRVAGGR
jgi:squalene synthase HpnC